MKKIMIMLSAVAMAACVQAASVSWAATITEQGANYVGNGAFVMAFSGADYDAVIDLVTVSGSETMQADLAAFALGSKAFANNRGAAMANDSITDAPNSVFWMVFTEGSYDAGKSVMWTAKTDVTANMYEPPASGTAVALNATTFANSGTIADVPEPTSGLLLLLGVAGLALRRKQK